MSLFRSAKKIPGPYKESSTNLIYQLLFCDNLDLFKTNARQPFTFPYDILFSDKSTPADLERVIDDPSSDPRVKLLAYNRQRAIGYAPIKKELIAVVVELGLENGLDVLASFNNGTARYINQSGKMIIWETVDEASNALTQELFLKSQDVVSKIGPWDQPRRPFPAKGNVRLSFLVSDGLYFGEGEINSFFNDPLARPTLNVAAALMNYLIERSLDNNKNG